MFLYKLPAVRFGAFSTLVLSDSATGCVCTVTRFCFVCHSGYPSLKVSAALNSVVTISRITITYPSIQVHFRGYSRAVYLFTPEHLR